MIRVHYFTIGASKVSVIYNENSRTFKMQIDYFPNDCVFELMKYLITGIFCEENPSPVKSDLIFEDKEIFTEKEKKCLENLKKRF